MDEQDFKDRTQQMTTRITRLVDALPQARSSHVMGERLMHAATTVGLNARRAVQATTKANKTDFLTSVKTGADEILFWLDLIVDAEIMSEARLEGLISDVNEIVTFATEAIKPQRRKKS